ncbi:hypothetical protein MVES1_001150 [Malassezia vespertilionis]|uniref:uncharacterized protein n=1 Tax=Malassezia vespertilionis TaxID=2020962 RepID=UPI0024B0F259|nr:uncharacterized protein MVES1_001150 [Malassezia vespertilionis]WFD05816.1 hypothetical protein MVES1_001150 [Malassezia vespertilionis]
MNPMPQPPYDSETAPQEMNTNVPHLGHSDVTDRKKIRSTSKQVSEDPSLFAEQPAVVAPELASDSNTPIPAMDQDAQTGPEMVGAEDPQHDTVKKKNSFFNRLFSGFKKSKQ